MKTLFAVLILSLCLVANGAQTVQQIATGAAQYGGFSAVQLEAGQLYLVNILAGNLSVSQIQTGLAQYLGFSDQELQAAQVYLLNNISGVGGAQTPWTSDINGGGFQLTNASFSVGSPSGFVSSSSNINFYIGTNYGFFVWGQNNGTNTPLFDIPWVASPGKWYFNVGVQNPASNAGEGIKDVHFYLENAWFFDIQDGTKNIYWHATSGGQPGGLPNYPDNGNAAGVVPFGTLQFVYNGGPFNTIAASVFDFGCNLFPVHIESQRNPIVVTGPTITVKAAAGTTGTASADANATDTAMEVTVTPSGASIAAGILFTNAFETPYLLKPKVVAFPQNANAAGASCYIDTVTATTNGFNFKTGGALSSGQAYIWDIVVIGTIN
jgi:hypothetical protein